MIESAAEFIRLRTSEVMEEYNRAAHDEAPLEVWWELVREHPDFKVWVVHNKTVPLEILDALSRDDDAAVRCEVARKRKASPEILERLARDPHESVRHAVVYNAKTPDAILRLLVDDSWDTVAAAAKERLRDVP